MRIGYITLGAAMALGVCGAAAAQPNWGKPATDGGKAPANGYGQPTQHATGYIPPGTSGYGEKVSFEFPPNARPGQCFARYIIPAKEETYYEQVIDQPEHTDIRVIKAVWGFKDEQVTVSPEHTEFVTIPATFKIEHRHTKIRDEIIRPVVVPAVYETKTERVLERAAYTHWKQGVGLTTAGYATKTGSHGEILCLVEEPAVYKTVTTKVLVKPERVDNVIIPAVYKDEDIKVVDTPARVEERKIPAVIKTKKVWEEITPARTETVVVPATYKRIAKTKIVEEGKVEWNEILCETNTTREIVIKIQVALIKNGHKVHKTGVFDRESWEALKAYQREHHVREGQLTLETVRALGVSY